MYRIKEEQLSQLYAAISGEMDVFAPVKKAGQTDFALWQQDSQVDFYTTKTNKSPKDLFFPQSQVLYTTDCKEGKLTITPAQLEQRGFAVFGIRPCDVKALEVLDRVFLSEPVDSFYAARRKNGVLISMACSRPDSTCFCGTFGIDCAQPKADVAVWLTGGYLYWEAQSEKGEALTRKVAALLEETDNAAVEAEKEAIAAIRERLPLKDLTTEGWGAVAAKNRFESPIWEQMASTCLACGTCTFVCPTCQCYDIKDYTTGTGTQRYRCWDSCMYSDFTMMAHGNNRNSQAQRYRQRFLHKLAYFPANNDGEFSCVGCGRCVEKCPNNLHIVKVMKTFGKEE